MALVFNFMKVLDPGSTVRESEYASAENARAIPDTVRNLYNRVVDGLRLTEEQRVDFVTTAATQFMGEAQQQTRRRGEFQSLADHYKVPESALPGLVDEELMAKWAPLVSGSRATGGMQTPTQQGGYQAFPPQATLATDAPTGTGQGPRMPAAMAEETAGGRPPGQWQYGQPGAGQPRGEFDMLKAGGFQQAGYGAGGPPQPELGGPGGTVPPAAQGQQLPGQGADLMQLGIALRDMAKLDPSEMGTTVSNMTDHTIGQIARGIPGMDFNTLPIPLLQVLSTEFERRFGQ